jgi:hypothetical protein
MIAVKFAFFQFLISITLLSLCRVAAANFPSSIMLKTATKTAEMATKIEAPVPAWPKTGNSHILISGGAGYIGTHTIVCLLEGTHTYGVVLRRKLHWMPR